MKTGDVSYRSEKGQVHFVKKWLRKEVAPLGIESLGNVFTLLRCTSWSVLGSANFGCLLVKQIMSSTSVI